MPILDLQRRGYQVGRIRLGQQVATKKGGRRPERLDTFRLTTPSRPAADRVAQLYGGTVREWENERKQTEWEVITTCSELGVTVPPRDQVVSQWYEMWSRGGCQRRCDSVHERISNGPCLCPQPGDPSDPDQVTAAAAERARLAGLMPPQACKGITRISVMLPDLPGLGIWRLDTGSFYAAVEIGDQADVLEMARDRGVFLPAVLKIEYRTRVARGETKIFPVPVLEIRRTLRELVSGDLEAGGIAAQIGPPPPGAVAAIEAPRPAPAAQPPEPEAPLAEGDLAADLGRRAAGAGTRAEVEALAVQARDAGIADDMICTDEAGDVWEALREVLQDRWRQLGAEGKKAA